MMRFKQGDIAIYFGIREELKHRVVIILDRNIADNGYIILCGVNKIVIHECFLFPPVGHVNLSQTYKK